MGVATLPSRPFPGGRGPTCPAVYEREPGHPGRTEIPPTSGPVRGKVRRLLRIALLAALLLVPVTAPAGAPDFAGHYELAPGDLVRTFSLDVTMTGSRADISFSAGHVDGSGAAPDADGKGKVDSQGVLQFRFRDSFENEGSGTLAAVPNGYRLTLTLSTTYDPRVLSLYDNLLLKKGPPTP